MPDNGFGEKVVVVSLMVLLIFWGSVFLPFLFDEKQRLFYAISITVAAIFFWILCAAYMHYFGKTKPQKSNHKIYRILYLVVGVLILLYSLDKSIIDLFVLSIIFSFLVSSIGQEKTLESAYNAVFIKKEKYIEYNFNKKKRKIRSITAFVAMFLLLAVGLFIATLYIHTILEIGYGIFVAILDNVWKYIYQNKV